MAGWTAERISEDYPSIDAKIDAKIATWSEKIGNWLTKVIGWWAEAIARVIGSWVSTVWAWVAKIGEKCCDKDNEEKRAEKAAKAKMRIKKAWNHAKKAFKSAWTMISWWGEAVVWTWKVAFNSARKSINGMRSEKDVSDETPESPDSDTPEILDMAS